MRRDQRVHHRLSYHDTNVRFAPTFNATNPGEQCEFNRSMLIVRYRYLVNKGLCQVKSTVSETVFGIRRNLKMRIPVGIPVSLGVTTR